MVGETRKILGDESIRVNPTAAHARDLLARAGGNHGGGRSPARGLADGQHRQYPRGATLDRIPVAEILVRDYF